MIRTFTFNVTYTPNDVNVDRADQAFIDVTLSDGEVYEIILRGTSLAPRLYVTPLTTYGNVEVGWQKQDLILLQNASNVSERLDSISMPNGYILLSENPPLPAVLGPRDSMWIQVEFQPTLPKLYDTLFTVFIDSPCVNSYSGELTGTGEVVKLDVPIAFMNYGLVRPCDCATRAIPLANYSQNIPITIDSVWIDGLGVTPLTPSTFYWYLQSTGMQTLPIVIPPQTFDTLEVTFCPNIPAIATNLMKIDTLHIDAHTPGWKDSFTTIVSGEREMNFVPNVSFVQFPPTRVDTSAQPKPITITVPGVATNPDGDSVEIDKVTFQPDQGVFTAVASTGLPLPWIIHGNQNFSIKVNFLPRAPKVYTARMLIHTIYPCNSTDTTVLVMGSGFAPAFGLQMAFDTARIGLDTFQLSTCDTLSLPIMISRDIPQEYMDILFHLGYDTTELELLNGFSPYTDSVTGTDTSDGANIAMNNGVNIKAGAIITLKFKVIGGPAVFPITLGNINFDSDSLVFFEIVAGVDHGVVEIDQPMISVTKLTNFDTVDVKDCKNETITVYNTGKIAVRFDSLSLPKWHKVTVPVLPVTLPPGDSVQLTVSFCPRDSSVFDTTITAYSDSPCVAIDTGTLMSVGYAPPFPFRMILAPDISGADSIGSISGLIMDTVEVPIFINRSIPVTPLDVKFTLNYDARALEYLSVTSPYTQAVVTDVPGTLNLVFPGSLNVDSGEFARVKFLMTVPDSATSTMMLSPGEFTSDSILFVKPRPAGDTSIVNVGPQCNITTLVFVSGSNSITAVHPNPASDLAGIDLSFMEDANPELDIINSLGVTVLKPMDGTVAYKGGSYHVTFNTQNLPSGAYSIIFHAGDYRASERFVVIR